MIKAVTIFGSLMLSCTLFAAVPSADTSRSVKIIISPDQENSVPSVIEGYLKPVTKPNANEAVVGNAPFFGFDSRITNSGKITITAFKPTVAIDGGEVGGYTGGLEYRATFGSDDLLKLGVSVIQISRPNMPKSLPGALLSNLRQNYTLDKHTSLEPVSPYIDGIEIEVSGKRIFVTIKAVNGYLREYYDGDIGGITGGSELKGTFSLSEYNALIGSKAPSEYLLSEKIRINACSKVLSSLM